MGKRTCTICGGRGSTTTSEWRPNPMGGLGQNVTVRRSCNGCGGSGSVWAPDPPRVPRPKRGSSKKRQASKGKSSAGKAKVPRGFVRKKSKAGAETVGTFSLDESGELRVEPTQEEIDRAGAALFSLLAAMGIGIAVGYQVNIWVSLAFPVVGGGAVYWLLRKNPFVVRLLKVLFLLAVVAGIGYLIYLFAIA